MMRHLNSEQRRDLGRILISGILFLAAVLLPAEGALRTVLFLLPYLLAGREVLKEAGLNLLHGKLFDENFLMSAASIGAFALGDCTEAVGVMLFYQAGEFLQSCAVDSSRRSIAALTDIRPDMANLLRNGQTTETDPEDIVPGELILIRPGERVPLDGVVREGVSSLDTAALTGESLPRDIAPGDEILSGCINISGVLTVEVTKPASQSTVTRILTLVEDAASRKARSEDLITRFAGYYTPAVVITAALLAVIPGLITGLWSAWIHRALVFLVISCPCALVISVPLSFFGGIGGASARGILVKGGNYLEQLSKAGTVVFDKTGTLTQGRFSLASLRPAPGVSGEQLLQTAAMTECHSGHPIACSLRAALPDAPDPARVTGTQEHPGLGITATVDGVPAAAGNASLMEQLGLTPRQTPETDTVVHAAADGRYLGYILLADTPKPAAAAAVSALRARNIRTVMLTGDRESTASAVGNALDIEQVYARLLPADKVERLERLLAEKEPGKTLIYVGDGINDAPVLSRADVGIAMGAAGADAAIEAADIVFMDDDPMKLITAIDLSRKCLRIVRENIIFSLGIKALFLLLGAFGMATMWEAVFADVGVALIAIVNAGRMLGKK